MTQSVELVHKGAQPYARLPAGGETPVDPDIARVYARYAPARVQMRDEPSCASQCGECLAKTCTVDNCCFLVVCICQLACEILGNRGHHGHHHR
jgi:hypothetical protein